VEAGVSRRDPGPLRWEAPQAERLARRARRRRALGRAAYVLLLVAALASVVWRQTAGEERFRELEQVREELRQLEARKVDLQAEIVRLSRRERIVREARERLGMHVARDDEIVLLPLPASSAGPSRETKDTVAREGEG
jgi:cell division protein FtsL